jgi:cell division GTPase FtsZ
MSQKLTLPNEVKALLNENHKYLLLAGLGGYTGTNMTEQITSLLRRNKKNFMAICGLPFYFEGQVRRLHADRVKIKLQTLANFKYFELQNIREKYGNLLMKDAFQKADEQSYLIYKDSI